MTTATFTLDTDAFGASFRALAFEGDEGLSVPFVFDVEGEVPGFGSIADERHVPGQDARLHLRRIDGSVRTVIGVILSADFESPRVLDVAAGKAGDARRIRIRLVPELWVVGLRTRKRIFQEKTTIEIVTLLLDELGIRHRLFLTRAPDAYVPRDCCVQYAVSDVDFITRILAEDGFFFFFQTIDDACVMILADGDGAYGTIDDGGILRFSETPLTIAEEHVTVFGVRGEVGPKAVVFRDYDFHRPRLDQTVRAGVPDAIEAPRAYERYEYPGQYIDPSVGIERAQMRLRALRRGTVRGQANGNCRRLEPGKVFLLEDHPIESNNRRWVVTAIHHRAVERGIKEGGPTYENTFAFVPADVVFFPLPSPKPSVQGVEVARVTGDVGEEITDDADGRIHVRFPWDREGPIDSGSSCLLRVAQPWAGTGYGVWFLPRIGMEVVVSFVGGDPDKPLVTGCVYNGDHPLPFKQPNDKTRSGIRTHSSPHGEGFNELSFEDQKGKEQVFLRAERNFDELVQANHTTQVGGAQSTHVGGNDSTVVNGKREAVIGGIDRRTAGNVFSGSNGSHVLHASSMFEAAITGGLGADATPDEVAAFQNAATTHVLLTPQQAEVAAPKVQIAAGATTGADDAESGAVHAHGDTVKIDATAKIEVGIGRPSLDPKIEMTTDHLTLVAKGQAVEINKDAGVVRVKANEIALDHAGATMTIYRDGSIMIRSDVGITVRAPTINFTK